MTETEIEQPTIRQAEDGAYIVSGVEIDVNTANAVLRIADHRYTALAAQVASAVSADVARQVAEQLLAAVRVDPSSTARALLADVQAIADQAAAQAVAGAARRKEVIRDKYDNITTIIETPL